MYENLSDQVPKDNIVNRRKNQVVTTRDFMFDDNDFSSKFDKDECMLKEIQIARRLYYRILGKRLRYFVPDDARDDYDGAILDDEMEMDDDGMDISIVGYSSVLIVLTSLIVASNAFR